MCIAMSIAPPPEHCECYQRCIVFCIVTTPLTQLPDLQCSVQISIAYQKVLRENPPQDILRPPLWHISSPAVPKMYCSRIDVCSSSRRACNFVSMMCLSSGNARSQGSKQCTSTPGTDTTCTEKQSTSWHLCHYRGQEGFWLEDYHIVNECKATGEKPAQPLWHAKDPQHASMHAGRTLRQIETTCKTPRYNVPC